MLARPQKKQIAWQAHTLAHAPQAEHKSLFTTKVLWSVFNLRIVYYCGRKDDVLADQVALQTSVIYLPGAYAFLYRQRCCRSGCLTHGDTGWNNIQQIVSNKV